MVDQAEHLTPLVVSPSPVARYVPKIGAAKRHGQVATEQIVRFSLGRSVILGSFRLFCFREGLLQLRLSRLVVRLQIAKARPMNCFLIASHVTPYANGSAA